MTLIQTDMRDLRGGVTRQLVEQYKRLGVIRQKIGTIEDNLGKQGDHLSKIETKIDEVLKRLPMT